MKFDFKTLIVDFFSLLLGAIFLIVIFLPIIDETLSLDLDTDESTEKRALAVRPDFNLDSLETFSKRYENYTDDNFSFRNFLVKINTMVSSKVYDVSAVPDVLIGKNGWLYYVAKSQGSSLEDYMGLIRVDSVNLKWMLSSMERTNLQLTKMGIEFVFVVVPDKQTIYPEFLPSNVHENRRYPTRLIQIMNYLGKHSSMQIIDLGAPLKNRKNVARFPFYKKTDSHWNHYGAFSAYQEIMKSMKIEPLRETDFTWNQPLNLPSGDLAGMLGASDQFMEDNEIQVKLNHGDLVSFKEIENEFGKFLVSTNVNKTLPKLVLFHDSFGPYLQPFLCYNFRECIFVNGRYSQEIVDKEKPDVVMVESVERYVDRIMVELP
jgi:SGNH hydrolase-like domain, acetyltransferase AlgX